LLRSSLLVPVFAMTLVLASPVSSAPSADIAAIEHSVDLARLMKEHGVPGLSVAVIRHFELAWAKGYGVTELGGHWPVTTRTLFLAGSISKPVTALGALALVDSGRLSLDADVNPQLKSWHIPPSEYSSRKVTLGLLLSHTAGFTGGEFFPGYVVGEPVPSLVQVLDGAKPANNPSVRLGATPGSKWRYSGDGYLVVQQLMIDVTGRPFPQLMRELVLDRLAMRSSTFEQPLPQALDSLAARGTRRDGTAVAGGWRVSPEMAAAGLWTTPTDLALLAIGVARAAQRDGAGHVLSSALAQDMLEPHAREGVINILGTPNDPDAMGYGFFVGEKRHRFGHIGGHVGYQATLVFFADTGDGAVILTNSDVGLLAGNELLDAIARHYQWNWVTPPLP